MSANSIQETLSTNEVVGFLASVDADTGDTHAYSLVAGSGSADNAHFTISGTNLQMSIAPDYELPQDDDEDNIYDIRVSTNDGNGGLFEQSFQVTVTDNSADNATPDTDGISDSVENAAPNGGDFNGDGTLDSLQAHVASIPNSVISGSNSNNPNHYNGLVLGNGRTVDSFSIAGAPATDGDYTYPLGMFSFTISASSIGATETVTLLLDREYTSQERSSWVWRKHDGSTYAMLPSSANLAYGVTTVGSFNVTSVSYEITDGGSLDTDGLANGSITDPVGPAVLGTTSPADSTPLANTGVGVSLQIVAAVMVVLGALSTIVLKQKHYRL